MGLARLEQSFSFGHHRDMEIVTSGDTAISVHNRYVALHAARPGAGASIELPDAPFLHLFATDGAVDLEGVGELGAADAVRFTATGGQRLTASHDAEILVWEMHATIPR